MEETETLSRAEFSGEIEDYFANILSANETGDPELLEYFREQRSDFRSTFIAGKQFPEWALELASDGGWIIANE